MALERAATARRRACSAPRTLAEICASDDHARASHALGKSYSDVVRGFRGRFEHPPDFVVRPREETDLERVLEWCSDERVAAIPYGGGTSVVGGVSPDVAPTYNGAISVDLRALDRVLEVDAVSRAARIQGGAARPGPRGAAGRAFPDPAPLSPVVRVLHPRRLDRHARGRPFRDGVDAHRGLRGVRARDHARRRVGVATAAGIGRGREPRSDARGLGGNAGADHRGVGARAAAPLPPALGGGALSELPRRGRVRACDQPVGSEPRELPSARSRRGAHDDGRRRLARAARARLRVHRPSRR